MFSSLLSSVAATITINGSTSTVSDSDFFAVFGAMFMGFMVFGLIIMIIGIIAMWKIFTKCGQEGWKSIIPIYNYVVLCQITGINPLWILALLLPIVGGIFGLLLTIATSLRLAKGFGKGTGFAIGLILLSFIFYLILGFDKSTWDPSKMDTNSFSFLNSKDAPKGGAAPAGDAKGTPEDPWVEGKQA